MALWTAGSHRAKQWWVAWVVGMLAHSGPVWGAGPPDPGDTTPPPARPASGPPAAPPPSAPAQARSPVAAKPTAAGSIRSNVVSDPFADPAAPRPEVPAAEMSATEDLSRTWTYSQGKATPPPRYVSMSPERVQANPIGFYSGVSVARAGTPPPKPPQATVTAPVLTWTGYEPKRPGSRVFFQFSSPVQHEMIQDGLIVRMRFPGATVTVKNNLRPLELTYHATVVNRVKVRRRQGAVEATIELKRAGTPTVRTVAAENGYSLIVVEFAE